MKTNQKTVDEKTKGIEGSCELYGQKKSGTTLKGMLTLTFVLLRTNSELWLFPNVVILLICGGASFFARQSDKQFFDKVKQYVDNLKRLRRLCSVSRISRSRPPPRTRDSANCGTFSLWSPMQAQASTHVNTSAAALQWDIAFWMQFCQCNYWRAVKITRCRFAKASHNAVCRE